MWCQNVKMWLSKCDNVKIENVNMWKCNNVKMSEYVKMTQCEFAAMWILKYVNSYVECEMWIWDFGKQMWQSVNKWTRIS